MAITKKQLDEFIEWLDDSGFFHRRWMSSIRCEAEEMQWIEREYEYGGEA